MIRDESFAARDSDAYAAHRRAIRRWVWTHPHRTPWRALAWLRWSGVPPWRLTATMIAFINPRPLPPEKLAALREYLERTGGL